LDWIWCFYQPAAPQPWAWYFIAPLFFVQLALNSSTIFDMHFAALQIFLEFSQNWLKDSTFATPLSDAKYNFLTIHSQAFVDAGVKHVIAVCDNSYIKDSVARTFASEFYYNLFVRRNTVQSSFDIALQQIATGICKQKKTFQI
jgi:hypothetical protein